MAMGGTVSDFYRNKSVLITGGTGSLGKILIEILLRKCPGITRIYLLVRSTERSGSTASERFSNLLKIQIFDKLRREKADIFEKIIMVQGELKLPNIGLSESDKGTLIDNVSIVFHCASEVKFDSHLKDIMSNNVFGTLHFLQLCQQMKKIEAFIYVSTLFSTCNHTYIEERLPQIPHFDGILDYGEINRDEFVKLIPKDLVDEWPNTYTFSKAVTEIMLNRHKNSLPIGIVRPSVILSTLKEPIPGWIDNFYGPTLMVANSAVGFVRSRLIKGQGRANVIPADIVVNLLICAGWKTAKEKSREIKIYNCCSGERNPIPWGKFGKQCLDHKSLTRLWVLVSIFAKQEWIVDDYNVVELNDELDAIDRNMFLIDVGRINWSNYIGNYIKGIRIHLLKDSMDSIEEARARRNTLYWREILIQLFLLLVIIVPVSVIVRLVMF